MVFFDQTQVSTPCGGVFSVLVYKLVKKSGKCPINPNKTVYTYLG